MRRAVAIVGFSTLCAALIVSFALLPTGASRAASDTSAVFLIPPSEGYGVAQCLSEGGDCGRVVANAFCEAQGYARAESFGATKPEDVTGSVPSGRRTKPVISITCVD